MKHTYAFEKLEVWHEAKNLAKEVYRITLDLPDTEKYGLLSQLRRSAVSVPSNIAEGSSRLTKKSKGHFYEISYSSLMELYNQLIISDELGLIEFREELRSKFLKTSNLLNKLHKSTLTT